MKKASIRKPCITSSWGYDRVGYSRAFDEYRMEAARGVFPTVCTVLAVLVIAGMVFKKVRSRKAERRNA